MRKNANQRPAFALACFDEGCDDEGRQHGCDTHHARARCRTCCVFAIFNTVPGAAVFRGPGSTLPGPIGGVSEARVSQTMRIFGSNFQGYTSAETSSINILRKGGQRWGSIIKNKRQEGMFPEEWDIFSETMKFK